MPCDWLEKWTEFKYHDTLVRLQGMVSSQPQELKEVSIDQVLKWQKGNGLWAIVLLEPSYKSHSLTDNYLHNGIPAQIKDLFHEYGTLFQESNALPPARLYDHSITLLPNAPLVNCRPYRYSPE
jgi:hypothetical protein